MITKNMTQILILLNLEFHHSYYLILNFIIYINYVFTVKEEMTRVKKIKTGRQKRASGSYSVELLIVVDYAVYQR